MDSATVVQSTRTPHAGAVSEEIPVLDLAEFSQSNPAGLSRLARELRQAQEEIGFFCVVNHGVPQALIDQVYAEDTSLPRSNPRSEDKDCHQPRSCWLHGDMRAKRCGLQLTHRQI